ncbi:MAG: hypothetical protein ACFUZC_10415 [Chthoniobacteraceae bacterium]
MLKQIIENPLRLLESWKPSMLSAENQSERRAKMCQLAAALARECFDHEGNWLLPSFAPDARERLWLCFALMQGTASDQNLGNAILAQTPFTAHMPAGSLDHKVKKMAKTGFDIFVTNLSMQMLVLHRGQLLPAVREKLESWARAALANHPGDRQADYQFQGYNDNMPAEAAAGMILAGEYFGDIEAVGHGLWSLRQLRDLLTRRGLFSEFNSPTYSPIILLALTEVNQHAHNAEARELASQCMERLWAELLGHFHSPTGMLSGPFSRAYTTDSLGHLSNATYLLWQVFGETVLPNPVVELLRKPHRLVLHHNEDFYFAVAQFSWLAVSEYQPPAHLMEWIQRRVYPFRLSATAERGEGLPVFGRHMWSAKEVLVTNYQEADFAMGTSEGDWGGQAEEFFIRYRRCNPAVNIEDTRTIYPRYLVNDAAPGRQNPNHHGLGSGEEGFLSDAGRYHTVQQDRIALISVTPNPVLATQPVTMLRFAMIVPEHFNEIEQIEFSDGHVWLQDGPLYLALRPLGTVDWGRKDAITIEKVNGLYRVISFINYQGPPRQFTGEEFSRTLNGIVAIVGTRKDETFDAFQERVLEAELLDYEFQLTRTVRYRLGKTVLGLNYGLDSNEVRFATINGRVVTRRPWMADGLPPEKLPFLDEDPVPNSLEFPFSHLNVDWNEGAPWHIFSTGRTCKSNGTNLCQ